jgi:hypothetical protein
MKKGILILNQERVHAGGENIYPKVIEEFHTEN